GLEVEAGEAGLVDLEVIELVVAAEPADRHTAGRVVGPVLARTDAKPVGVLGIAGAGDADVARPVHRQAVAAIVIVDLDHALAVADLDPLLGAADELVEAQKLARTGAHAHAVARLHAELGAVGGRRVGLDHVIAVA